MPAITSQNVTNAILKAVADQFLPALKATMMMANLVNRQYEPTLQKAGDTVNITLPPTMQANNIAEGGTVVLQNPNAGNAQVVLNSHVESSFALTDIVRALASVDMMRLVMEPAVIAIAERMESDLLSLYAGFTQNPKMGAPATLLTEAVIGSAETQLFNQKMPVTQGKYLVLDGNTYDIVRSIPRFSELQTIGAGLSFPSPITTGQVGKLKDFLVFRSQLVPKTTANNVITNHGVAFGRDAIALVSRKLDPPLPGTGVVTEYLEMDGYGFRVSIGYNQPGLQQMVTIDTLYGASVLRNNFGIEVQS